MAALALFSKGLVGDDLLHSSTCCRRCWDLHSGATPDMMQQKHRPGGWVGSWAPVCESGEGNRDGGCVRWRGQEAQDSGSCLAEKAPRGWVDLSQTTDEERGYHSSEACVLLDTTRPCCGGNWLSRKPTRLRNTRVLWLFSRVICKPFFTAYTNTKYPDNYANCPSSACLITITTQNTSEVEKMGQILPNPVVPSAVQPLVCVLQPRQ